MAAILQPDAIMICDTSYNVTRSDYLAWVSLTYGSLYRLSRWSIARSQRWVCSDAFRLLRMQQSRKQDASFFIALRPKRNSHIRFAFLIVIDILNFNVNPINKGDRKLEAIIREVFNIRLSQYSRNIYRETNLSTCAKLNGICSKLFIFKWGYN